MQVGDLRVSVIDFVVFYHLQFFTQMSYLLTNCYNVRCKH